MGIEQIRRLKEEALLPKVKVRKAIPKKSAKKIAQEKEQKELLGDNDTLKEQWFKARRKEMVGCCQCGCGKPSQKKDDMYFRHSIAHVFNKKDFQSIMYHPLNWVERAFWGGDHTNMDEGGMDKWVNMADFDDIVEKFHVLVPLLTDKEKSKKFYINLEKLVYGNMERDREIKRG